MTQDRMLASRYELDHEIGRGGMGSVWLGRDTVLGRAVAIKQIGMVAGARTPDLGRAEREAHLAARVNHHNVVAVFDLVDDDGHQWLVMEYVDGPSLAGLIGEQGPMAPATLAPIVEQVAGALAAAHEHGIVHRDVKPSNILLTASGTAKLSDFGIARAQADASLTQTGLVTGSPAYLSPEVVSGGTATGASDVWSLGATVFHALAGHPPYDVGDNLLGAMYRIVNEEPPRLSGGGRLAPLVESMMQHDPEARPTMTEIAAAVSGEESAGAGPAEQHAPPAADLDLESTQAFTAFADAAQPAPTAAFAPLQPAPPTTDPSTTDPLAADPVTAGTHAPAVAEPHRGRRDLRSWKVWLVAAAAALVAAIVVVVGSDDDPSSSPSASGTPSTGSTSRSGASMSDAMEGFASDYLTAASNDPAEGFALLTPAYQRASGGISGYTGFWGGVSNVDVQSVTADPGALTVTYRYSYDYEGRRTTEDVTLQLQKNGDSYLIAGAS